jgi:hypothetical protein
VNTHHVYTTQKSDGCCTTLMQFLTNEQSQKLTAMRIKEKLNGLLAEV